MTTRTTVFHVTDAAIAVQLGTGGFLCFGLLFCVLPGFRVLPLHDLAEDFQRTVCSSKTRHAFAYSSCADTAEIGTL